MSDTDTSPYIDKYTQCETYALTDSPADLTRRMHAHELACHGRVKPTRPDHGERNYR